MRSTTELRQHFLRERRAYDGARRGLSTRLNGTTTRLIWRAMAKDKEREERLAAALRENLRRRKAQARAVEDGKKERED